MDARRFRTVCYALLAGSLVSCQSDFPTAPQPTGNELRESLTGEAAMAVNEAGKFVLPAPPPSLASVVAPENASRLAVVWARQFGPLLRANLEGVHGGSIGLAKLVACGRPLYAGSAFEEPPLDVLPSARRAVGPWWLITLCEGAIPKVSVAVSAWATELTIENDRIVFPTNFGMEFYGHGIPLGHSGEYPVSPERAAVSTAQQTGRRVSSVPNLIADFRSRGHPGHARWGWQVEGSVAVRTLAGRSVSASEVYAGEAIPVSASPILFIPEASQPDTVLIESPPPGIFGESRESYEERVRTQTRIIRVARRSGVAALFDRIVAVEGGS